MLGRTILGSHSRSLRSFGKQVLHIAEEETEARRSGRICSGHTHLETAFAGMRTQLHCITWPLPSIITAALLTSQHSNELIGMTEFLNDKI